MASSPTESIDLVARRCVDAYRLGICTAQDGIDPPEGGVSGAGSGSEAIALERVHLDLSRNLHRTFRRVYTSLLVSKHVGRKIDFGAHAIDNLFAYNKLCIAFDC